MKSLDALGRERPGSGVTDFITPVMNGLELAQVIKFDPERASVLVILLSGAQGAIARAHLDLFAGVYDKAFRIGPMVARSRELLGSDGGAVDPREHS
jgi:CheY-like chemotaxis protein